MLPLFLIFIITASAVTYILLKPKLIERRRNKIRKQPFPKKWREILRRNVPYFYNMPADLQLQLKQHLLVFIDEKDFMGFEGIQINDEIKVTIAAQACLLLLNRDTNYYRKLKSIYVYPEAFVTKHPTKDAAGVVHEQRRVLSGESWELGKVILSWKDTKDGAKIIDDGRNVVIHEFAHQLDQETGSANGAPFLKHKNRRCWSEVLSKEFDVLQSQTQRGEASLLDKYGATNPAEFFAVSSEVFFEQPQDMQEIHPQLYSQLQGLYQIHPALWI
jgi:Mlc titration factor MtfA (ptsG expression regulator)